MTQQQNDESSIVKQQILMLNLRINDMITQLNIALKTALDENSALKKENETLKVKK
jgi:hypothetical protein